jgi:transposase
MSVRTLLTDDAWDEIEPILTALKNKAGSPPELSDRQFIAAVLYLARTGLPWRDLPAEFGHGDAQPLPPMGGPRPLAAALGTPPDRGL